MTSIWRIGGGRGVEIGGSRVVHGVAAVAVQGAGAAASLVLWFLSGRASFSVAAAAVRQRVWPAPRRSRYLEPPKVGFTTVVDLWFARGQLPMALEMEGAAALAIGKVKLFPDIFAYSINHRR